MGLSTLQAVDVVKVFRNGIILILYNVIIIISVERDSFCNIPAQHNYADHSAKIPEI